MTEANKYPVIITSHARERYVVRISDPVRYSHLNQCKLGCEMCTSLAMELRQAIVVCRRGIDRELSGRILAAIRGNKLVQDQMFLSAIAKIFPAEVYENSQYYMDEKAIYVIVREKDGPVLVTVLSLSMLDGTILRSCKNIDDFKKVFATWKREAKVR